MADPSTKSEERKMEIEAVRGEELQHLAQTIIRDQPPAVIERVKRFWGCNNPRREGGPLDIAVARKVSFGRQKEPECAVSSFGSCFSGSDLNALELDLQPGNRRRAMALSKAVLIQVLPALAMLEFVSCQHSFFLKLRSIKARPLRFGRNPEGHGRHEVARCFHFCTNTFPGIRRL